MAYRIVSIENPAEVHVRDGQLVVIQDKGTVTIPIRDILVLVVCGPNIRMSTMAQTMLASSKVVMLFLGRNHHPVAMTLPVVGYSRQARVMQAQAAMSPNLRSELWRRIIVRKIENQAVRWQSLGSRERRSCGPARRMSSAQTRTIARALRQSDTSNTFNQASAVARRIRSTVRSTMDTPSSGL